MGGWAPFQRWIVFGGVSFRFFLLSSAVSTAVTVATSVSASAVRVVGGVAFSAVISAGWARRVVAGIVSSAAVVAVVASITAVVVGVVVAVAAILVKHDLVAQGFGAVSNLFNQPLEGWGFLLSRQSSPKFVVHMWYLRLDHSGDNVHVVEGDGAGQRLRFVPFFFQLRRQQDVGVAVVLADGPGFEDGAETFFRSKDTTAEVVVEAPPGSFQGSLWGHVAGWPADQFQSEPVEPEAQFREAIHWGDALGAGDALEGPLLGNVRRMRSVFEPVGEFRPPIGHPTSRQGFPVRFFCRDDVCNDRGVGRCRRRRR